MTDVGGGLNAADLGEAAQRAVREGRGDEAVALWDRALAVDARHTGNLIAMAQYLVGVGDPQGAIARCSRVLEAHPDLYPIWLELGIIQYNCFSDLKAALNSLNICVQLNPEYKAAHCALAELHCLAHNPELMRHHGTLALSNLNSDLELYIAMRCLADYELCIFHARKRLTADPDHVETLKILGKSLRLSGRYEEARQVMTRAAELSPFYFEVHHQLGELMMLAGDLQAGWRQMEKTAIDIYLRGSNPRVEAQHERRWRGQSLEGKTLLLAQYAGFGDNLMFARYGRSLQRAGAHVTLACKPELYRLMSAQSGFDSVTDNTSVEIWQDFDYWAVDYYVPPYLGAADGVIPGDGLPFISPPVTEATYWRKTLGADRGSIRVGLCWASQPHQLYGLDRSISPELLASLAEIDGVEWFAMQRFSDHEQVQEAFGGRLIDYSGDWRDFADSAGLMAQLDLMISIDSSPLHLAGALGVPTWGLIPFSPEWRWGLTGDHSPWYASLRLFRQPRLPAWAAVSSKVRQELTLRVASRRRRKYGTH